jgi:sigma-B regulation protein RsbU (phosphoserine phosphatase)
VERLGKGGLPIGLIPGATYDWEDIPFSPGDRLVLVSDGFTECPLPSGTDFGEEGLMASLKASAGLSGADLLEALTWDLVRQSGCDSFSDDLSAVVLDLF